MRAMLIAADLEENLGAAMIAASLEQAGHSVEIVPFNEQRQFSAIVKRVVQAAPDLVGLSIQFQHRAHEFLSLCRALRACGLLTHVTCGGQFPSSAYQHVIEGDHGVDSVVLHEGERTVVDLCHALEAGAPLSSVAGLAIAGPDGWAIRTESRRLCDDLDSLPLASRYRPHSRHLGVPFIPISGSRGCWGSCRYCAITSFYRDAQAAGGGKRVRLRSTQSLAEEMALLYHAAGGAGIFCFHDDNFLLPHPTDTAARLRELKKKLVGLGVEKNVGLVGKCRPDSLTGELARELARMGVIRLYVGIENVSERGSLHLRRGVQTSQVSRALRACRGAGIFVCYNLLLFEPDATLDDVEENIDFIREHATHPVNFCRAEAYHGTALARDLADRGRLMGSYLGYDYRIADDRTELLFRICAAAFRERNFAPRGIHNRYMGLGYNARLLALFYDGPGVEAFGQQADALTARITGESADLLQEALTLAREVDLSNHEAITRKTADLAMRVAEADRHHHAQIDDLLAKMDAFARREAASLALQRPSLATARELLGKLARGVAVGALLSGWAIGASGCEESTVVDPSPSDYRFDVGSDGGFKDQRVDSQQARDQRMEIPVVDPAPPPDQGIDRPPVVDPAPPPDQGIDRPPVVDPAPPPDQGIDRPPVVDPAPPPDVGPVGQVVEPPDEALAAFRDTAPAQALRSQDLPLYCPPRPQLMVRRLPIEQGGVEVRLAAIDEPVSVRWESDGRVTGAGETVIWQPESETDQLRVGVRTAGGVAVVTLSAQQLERRTG